MKFALVDGARKEALPSLKGICPCCGSRMLARCGEVRVFHWAHKGRRNCDSWWENETEWHRSWKNQFPNDWQEIIHYSSNGEKHISDIQTSSGWVLEFQHSYLKPEERRSRENFYKQLIWVINGNRRSKDRNRFFEVLGDQPFNKNHPELITTFPEGALFRDWIPSQTHVLFDFGEEILWWLMPESNDFWAFLTSISREDFIALLQHNNSLIDFNWSKLVKKYSNILESWKIEKDATKQSINQNINYLERLMKNPKSYR
jgi:hypothetical protein